MATPPSQRVGEVVPGLLGTGVLYADPIDYDDIALALMGAGYSIHTVDGSHIVDRRGALLALAHALGLPGAADRNVDALADTLRDLAQWCPQEPQIVLMWQHADKLVAADKDLWDMLVEILSLATSELWTGGARDDIRFETIAFVEGHDIPALGLALPTDDPR